MAVQTPTSTRTASRRTTGTAARPSSRTGNGAAAKAAGQTRRVASTSADEGKLVASRAAGESQRVAAKAKDQGEAVARTAKDQGAAVARTAADSAREVKSTVRTQAVQVRDELAAQSRTVVDETRNKLTAQTQTQARRAAEGLTRLAAEAQALADGRPDEAETIRGYVAQSADRLFEAADRFYGLADDVESRGVEGLLSDLQRFARRRPGAFLLGAAVAGFGVGRAVRATQQDDEDDTYGDDAFGEAPATGRRSLSTRGRALGTDARAESADWSTR